MSCHDFEELVALDVEGDLDVAERRRLESHLRQCSACRQLAEDLKESQSAFKSVRQDVPDDATLLAIRTRVLADVTDMQAGSWYERLFFNGFRQRATLAGIALLMVAGWVFWQSRHAVQPAQPAIDPEVSAAVKDQPAPETHPVLVLAEASVPAPARKPQIRHPKPVPAPDVVPDVVPDEPPVQVTIKLLTDDPSVIIYWLGDEKGD